MALHAEVAVELDGRFLTWIFAIGVFLASTGMGVTGGPGKAATIMAAAGLGKPTGSARSGRMRAIPGPPASWRREAY